MTTPLTRKEKLIADYSRIGGDRNCWANIHEVTVAGETREVWWTVTTYAGHGTHKEGYSTLKAAKEAYAEFKREVRAGAV